MHRWPRGAPRRWATTPGQAAPSWASVWRGLTQAYVPDAGGGSAGNTSRRMVELLHGAPTNQGSGTYYGIEGLPIGPAMSIGNAPLAALITPNSARWGPAVGAAFSVFAFTLRRSTVSAFEPMIGNGYTGLGGWTLHANYGPTAPGRIGLTRWGNGDDVTTTTLGAVPNDGTTPSAIGVSWPVGGPSRFFLNGRFESVTSGTISGAGIGDFAIGRTSSGAMQGWAIHVIYMWNRALTDGEFLQLWRDPYGPIRPRHVPFSTGSSTTTLRVTQAVLEALASPTPALRVSQAVLEVLIANAGATSGSLRVTQALAEVLTLPTPSIRATQIVAEALVAAVPSLVATQAVAEVLVAPTPALQVTQAVLEVLVKVDALSVSETGLLYPRGSVPPF